MLIMNICWPSRVLGYATRIADLHRRRAASGDKILKGVETAVMSEEQTRKKDRSKQFERFERLERLERFTLNLEPLNL